MKTLFYKYRSILTLLFMASFSSLFLLIMNPIKASVLETFAAILFCCILTLWKKPQTKSSSISKTAVALAVATAAYLGVNFYSRYVIHPAVQAISLRFHMPAAVAVSAVAVCLSACAVYAIAGIYQQISAILTGKCNLCRRNIVICLLAAAITVILTQIMIDTFALSMGVLNFLFCVLPVLVIILMIYVLSGNVKLSAILTSGLFLILSTINVYVFQFRERLFEPTDIFSANTAMNVADNYSLFPIPSSIILGWCIWIVGLVLLVKKIPGKYKLPLKKRLLLTLCCLIGAASTFLYASELKPNHWQKQGAEYYGYVLDFTSKLKEMTVAEPEGYSKEQIHMLSEKYATDTDPTETKRPHIIVIMNEAFSDLSVVGELSTNKAVTPFISSLKEDTISGYALASVYGGNTANSEYEFLTGNTMAWMAPNCVPYQQYIKSSAYSMVSHLKTYYQYRCVAMHPFLSSGWNRPNTYANFGFDEVIFEEGFPQSQYVRNYISDREMFETVTDVYENNGNDPLFLFGVSMQNHGGYGYTGENFAPTHSLNGSLENYTDVEQYLSLLYETDKAVEYLISYFSQVEEDVVIVFFGDHQPKLNEDFYEELSPTGFNTLNDQQKKYLVPFFVWTNYDIEEQSVACTSLNYLSSYVYEAAGIPLPAYNRFLSEMEQIIPAINANGFYSYKTQSYLSFEQADEEQKLWLQQYKQLQYNSTFDKKNRNDVFFPVIEKAK